MALYKLGSSKLNNEENYSYEGAWKPKRSPHKNPLSWIFFQLERPFSGIINTIAEEQAKSRGLDIKRSPISAFWKGFAEGGHHAGEIVSNPIAKFFVSVGLDPITYIPFSWGTKVAKLPFKIGGGALARIVEKYPASRVAAMTEAFSKIHNIFIEKLGGPFAVAKKYSPNFVKEVVRPATRVLNRLENTFSKETERFLDTLVPNGLERQKLFNLVEQTPASLVAKEGGEKSILIDSFNHYVNVKGNQEALDMIIHGKVPEGLSLSELKTALDASKLTFEKVAKLPAHIPEKLMEEYLALSTPAKFAYQWHLKLRREWEILKAHHGFVSMKAMLKVLEETGRVYTPIIGVSRKAAVKSLKIRKALVEAGEEGRPIKEYLSDILGLDSLFPLEYRKLAAEAMRAKNYRAFKESVLKMANESSKGLEGLKHIQYNQGLNKIRQFVDDIKYEVLDDAEALRIGAEKIAKGDISPSLKKAFRDVFGSEPTGATISSDILNSLYAEEFIGPYKNLSSFYKKAMQKSTVENTHINELLKIAQRFPKEMIEKDIGRLDEIKKGIRYFEEGFDYKEATLLDTIRQEIKQSNKPFFSHERKFTKGMTSNEIIEKGLMDIETDLGRVMGVEGAALARGIAGEHLIRSAHKWLTKNNFLGGEMLTKEAFEAANMERITKKMVTRLSEHMEPAEARKIIREQGLELLDIDHNLFSQMTKEGAKYYVVPKGFTRELKRVFKSYTSKEELESFMGWWKKYQGWWKGWTLGPFPVYHTRNLISNIYNNFLAGLGAKPWAWNRDVGFYREAARLQHLFHKKGLKAADKKLWDELVEYGIVNTGETMGEIVNSMDRIESVLTMASLNPTKSPITRIGFWAGTNIENNARIAHYLWAKNAKKLSSSNAANSVFKYLFDYRRGLSAWETKWLRNFAAPFWAWTRFNIPLQLEYLAKRPAKVMAPFKIGSMVSDIFGGPDPEERYMANWLKGSSKIRTRYNENTNTYEYFILDNWIPAADLNKILSRGKFAEGVAGLLSPFATILPEILANFSLFKKRKIRDYPGQTKPIRIFGKKVFVAPEVDYLFRHIRLLNEIDRFFDEDSGVSFRGRSLRWFLGRTYPYRAEKQKQWWLRYTSSTIRDLKWYKALNERTGNKRQVEYLKKKISEMLAMRKYYQNLNVSTR